MEKKVLVVSDSHGNYTRLDKIIQQELPFAYLIHCGDGIGDLLHVDLPADVKIIKVARNIDTGRAYDVEEAIVTIQNRTILIVHGHRQYAKSDYDGLMLKGQESKVEFVFFGHTHLTTYVKSNPVLFNPGPVTNGFYGIVLINKEITFEHKRIE